ncbi:MAG: hypothetical protein ABSE63_16990 [Thermoguttaceae bacterium]|jgi:HEPN domain-containing protein
MTDSDSQFFQKFNFSKEQVRKHLQSAERDWKIARSSDMADVVFKFSYDALLKLAVYVAACSGLRVRSITGHHRKLLEKLSELIQDEDAFYIANEMRQKRNSDLYQGGALITDKDAESYLSFVSSVFESVLAKLPME